MAKRKITVTVDQELVEQTQALGAGRLSAVVNDALTAHVDRLARRAALAEQLRAWDEKFGAVAEEAAEAARAAFDELDATALRP